MYILMTTNGYISYLFSVVQFLLELNGLHVYMFETNAVVLIMLPSCDHKVLEGFGHTGSRHIDQFALVFACICPCQVSWGLSLLRTCINVTFDIEIPAFFNCVVTKIRTFKYRNSQSHLLRMCELPYFGRVIALTAPFDCIFIRSPESLR